MKALVVYESLWGNTATIARAIAEGIGPEARARRFGRHRLVRLLRLDAAESG